MKPVYILGINESHLATVALLKNGEIIACASEERFTRKKGQWGYPKKAVEHCLKEAGISSDVIEKVCLGFKNPTISINDVNLKTGNKTKILKLITPYLNIFLQAIIAKWPLFYNIYEFLNDRILVIFLKKIDSNHKKYIAERLRISASKIETVDHHLAHSYGAYYSNNNLSNVLSRKTLVITIDGIGDKDCSRVYVVEKNRWKEIASTPNKHTLGWLYLYVTKYLGMKPNEHEYKVMGLAPYAHINRAKNVYKIFKKLMWVENMSLKSKIPMLGYYSFIKKNLSEYRFDEIAGGIQLFTEEILITLISNAISETGINSVVLGGGVFMNVKANMKISKIKKIKNIYIVPSCGDESTAFGAAYYGYKEYCDKEKILFKPSPISNLYLGPKLNSKDIQNSISLVSKNRYIKYKEMKNPAKEIAKLLSRGAIIARCAGRMEFGARALGNRSILANPSNLNVVRIINDQIKSRDFWMPFAPVIIKERMNDYFINSKNIESPFMMFAFETTEKARKELIAAIHSYDFTARPQVLVESHNPEYYKIVKEFEKLTGIGGLLNTSFNIHGEPIVCTPQDAIKTFLNSGLRYLQLDKYLLEKIKK